MSKFLIIHRGSGTFMASEGCEVVMLDEEVEPETVAEALTAALTSTRMDHLISYALENGEFEGVPGA
jgi:hypothetical protein